MQRCKILCRSVYDREEIQAFSLMTEEEYRVNMILDNLPVAVAMYAENPDTAETQKAYELGYPSKSSFNFLRFESLRVSALAMSSLCWDLHNDHYFRPAVFLLQLFRYKLGMYHVPPCGAAWWGASEKESDSGHPKQNLYNILLT